MGMYHSTSGKRGFEAYAVSTEYQIEKEILRNVLIREDQLRASEEFQKEYSKDDNLEWLRDVTLRIQMEALSEYGIVDPRGLIVLRNARFKFKEDPSMNNLTVYMRQDRSKRGTLNFHDMAPDSSLCCLDGTDTTLFDYMKSIGNLPLIILAGSATWPPFRQAVDLLNCLQETYRGVVHFLAVYIAEAHAQDIWPLGNKVCLNQHKTLEERLQAAKNFQKDYKFQIPILVDKMDNNFDSLYASWPERFYIIENGKMEVIGFPTIEFGYDRQQICRWLENRQNVQNHSQWGIRNRSTNEDTMKNRKIHGIW